MALTKVTGSVLGETDPTDIDYTHSATGAVERTLQSKLGDIVSVKDFGAKGDGLTDDTDAIQSALESINGGGNLTAENGKTYLISSPLDIPNRVQAGSNFRRFSFAGAVFEQSTDNTPIFQLKGPTTNIYLGDFEGKYSNLQASTNLNASVIQIRESIASEYGANGAGVRFAVWDCTFENVFTGLTNSAASMFSFEDETYTLSTEPAHIWGSVFKRLYGFPTRRAIFGGVGGSAGSVVNRIEDCLFYGQNAGTVPFLDISQWTESRIENTEILELDTVSNVVYMQGCRNTLIGSLRIENCHLNTNDTAFILTTGGDANYTFDGITFTNCVIDVTIQAYGIKGFSSHNTVRRMSVSGSSSIDVQNGTFYLYEVDDNATFNYSQDFYSNLLTIDPTSDSYLYDLVDNGRYTSADITDHDYASTISGSGVIETPEFVIVKKDGYLIESSFTIDSSVGVDLFPKTLINGAEAYNAGLTIGNTQGTKGFPPLLKDAIAVSRGDKLSFSVNALGNTKNVSCSFSLFEFVQK